MDINCTHACFYQHNGKCSLKELPAYSHQSTSSSANNHTDCPYYADGASSSSHTAHYPNIIA